MKRWTILVAAAVVVLSALCLAKYLSAESGFGLVVSNGNELTVRISNLTRLSTHLSTFLNSSEYLFAVKNICLTGLLLLLTLWRAWLLKKAWK